MALVKIRNAANDAWITVASTGTTGPQGVPGLVWEGAWDSGTTYDVGDAVESGGSAYICILESTNNEPPNATYWELLASKGDTGATGAKGDTGATGAAGEVQSQDDTSTDNAIVRFHETTGHYIQNSGCTIDDSNGLTATKFYVGSSSDYIYINDSDLTVYAGTDDLWLEGSDLVFLAAGGSRRAQLSSTSMIPFSNKAYDCGISGNAWDDVYADDFQNVADVPYLDDRDDLATIMAIARGERVNERSGLPLIDDATLPEWLLSKDKTDGKTILRDEAGSPWVSTNNWVGLLLGAVRELTRRTEAQQAEIDALKAAVKALQGARRA